MFALALNALDQILSRFPCSSESSTGSYPGVRRHIHRADGDAEFIGSARKTRRESKSGGLCCRWLSTRCQPSKDCEIGEDDADRWSELEGAKNYVEPHHTTSESHECLASRHPRLMIPSAGLVAFTSFLTFPIYFVPTDTYDTCGESSLALNLAKSSR